MISEALQIYNQVDPAKKDARWADFVIQCYRRDWKHFVDPLTCAVNKSYLFSEQNMQRVKDSFKDKEFIKSVTFDPLPLLETIRTTLVEEILQAPPKPELKATDPSAISDRKEDIELLKKRKILEQVLSKRNAEVGLPPYKIGYDKFRGNVEDFDKMGLDERDPDDVNFYEKNYQRLNYEIAGQSVINNVLKTTRFDEETIQKFINDILAVRKICMEAYVDKITGEIKYNYIYPETAYGIFGLANDGKDDLCRGWQDAKSVMEWLQMVGNDFDFERDWKRLLLAINYNNAQKYTGFNRGGRMYDCLGDPTMVAQMGLTEVMPNVLDWNLAQTFRVMVGRIEWNSAEATATYLLKRDDPKFVDIVPYSYELDSKKEVTEYYKESYYQQQWYGSNFLATGIFNQFIYNFGKVFYQPLTGVNDEYAAGSLVYYREAGKSAIELVKHTIIDIANFAFYKMLWAVYKAKPEEDVYIYEELVQIAKGAQRLYQQQVGANGSPGTPVPALENVLNDAIKYQRENFVRLRSYPQIEGKTLPQLPPLEGKQNGIDPVYLSMQAVVMWADQLVAAKIGWSPQRSGANPPSRESTKSEEMIIKASFNSTGYFYRMIQYLKEHVATTTLHYAQDIIRFKDSVAYNWLLKLLGNERFEDLKLLDDFAPHRYGLFVQNFNSALAKQRVDQAADLALQQKQIDYDGWFIVTQTEDYKLGHKILAHIKLKTDKRLRRQAIEDQQMTDQINANAHKREMERLEFDRETKYGVADRNAKALILSAQIQTQGKKEVKQIQVDAEPEKQLAKVEGQKELENTKKNLEHQDIYSPV